jgi:very-short-patch-repair endonuclease
MPPRRDHDRRLLGFARQMRHELTEAERKMWEILRSRRLQGFKFRRQVPMCGYILDFYCVRVKLAIELDGGQHADPDAIAYDQRRADRLAAEGIRILRFWDDDVLKHSANVAEAIYDACCANPHPNPLPDYRERG